MRPTGGKLIPGKLPKSPATALLSLFHLAQTLPLTHQLHNQIIINGFHRSVLFGSKLSNAYIEMGSLHFAFRAFDDVNIKNLHSWNTIISGFSRNKLFPDVLRLFKRMRIEGHSIDSFNLVFALKACVGLSLLRDGKLVHSLVIKSGLERDPYVVPSLIDMYAELGSLEDAQEMFEGISERNTVIWGAMMKGYLKSSKEIKVFELLSQMRSSGFELDPFTSECLIRACGNVFAGREGKSFHGFCIKQDFFSSNICLQTSIVDMYLKCGLLDFALKLFKGIPNKDVVLWSTMVAGFAKNGRACEAITFFRQMQGESIILNSITLASVLLACSCMGSMRQGKSVHGYMIRNGVELDVVNYTSLIDTYAKCGCVVAAHRVFKEMPTRNVFSWSAMISGFGTHGLYYEAIAIFDQMRSENQLPNSITFVSVLSACSHCGRVEEGWDYFKSMSRDYGIVPVEEHFSCIVDLLCRAGKIDEALSFMSNMPIDPGASAWGALLSACRIHKRVELAEEVAKRLLPLEPDMSAVYVLLSNIYADAGMWKMVKKMRLEVGEKGFHKSVGFTSIEVDKKLYVFSSKDRVAYKDTQVENVWISLQEQMRELGYVLDVGFVL